jgi:2-polyprenyl-3-methyl-5-hydroxy-6-metoxy-1,4-benzoquinol methylase
MTHNSRQSFHINDFKETAEIHLKKILKKADEFYKINETEKSVQDTYGYFTRHVVSSLNHKRLLIMLCILLQEKEKRNTQLKVLDIACGGGLIARTVAEMGFPTMGIDINSNEIFVAKEFAKFFPTDTPLCFLEGDIINNTNWHNLAEKQLGGKPDVILMAYALHHLPQVERFVSKLSNWMKGGSFILINEENPLSPLFRVKHIVRTFLQNDTEEEHHRSFKEWKLILEKTGLDVYSPIGADPVSFIAEFLPDFSWSIIFTAKKNFFNGEL